jgi:NAD(P)-dependent dehydrogenase (short-subunit alcohol dehydrogenase family)
MTAAAALPLTGRVCVVTGASSGIGKAASIALAKLGASVVLVCRDRIRGEAAMAQITSAAAGSCGAPSLELADLASLGQVRGLAARLGRLPRIDALVNNAGLIGSSRRTTADGFEYTMAVNHLAPFLLTSLLAPALRASAPARVVTVSSVMHRAALLDPDDLQLEPALPPGRWRQRRSRSPRTVATASLSETAPPDRPPARSRTSSRVGCSASSISLARRYSWSDW